MKLQKNCDPIVGQSPAATRPDMVVGKKTRSFYCFFPHVNSDWIAKESGTAVRRLTLRRGGGYLEAKTWDIPWSKPASQPPRAAARHHAALRYIVH